MASSSLTEQLVKYLTDVHAMEVQALAQMRAAPALAGDPDVARAFEAHCEETERHEALIRERLEAHAAPLEHDRLHVDHGWRLHTKGDL